MQVHLFSDQKIKIRSSESDAFFLKVQKWALFTKGEKTEYYAIQDGAVSSFFFSHSCFDTVTLGILKLRMVKARGCKQ